MILNKSTKVKVRYRNGERAHFDTVAGLQQEATLASYLFITCLDYVLDIIKDNGFKLANKSRILLMK